MGEFGDEEPSNDSEEECEGALDNLKTERYRLSVMHQAETKKLTNIHLQPAI